MRQQQIRRSGDESGSALDGTNAGISSGNGTVFKVTP
jgi:hypothetical protein